MSRWERKGNKIVERNVGTICVAPMPNDGGVFAVQDNLDMIVRAPEMKEALTAINKLRGTKNGMADLFHVVVREEQYGAKKQVSIGDLIDAALGVRK